VTVRDGFTALWAGALAGFLGGLFGVGGGIVLVPLLVGRLNLTQHRAHGTSLGVVLFTSIAAGTVYAIHGNVAWLTGVVVAAASILTAPLGARLAARLSNVALKQAFSVFLLIVAARLLWTPPSDALGQVQGLARIGVYLGIGCAVGVIAGLMGVGGGILAVPAFRLLLGMPQQLAQGTSLLVILGAAASGAHAHARRGNVVMPLVPWLAVGAVVASPLSSLWVQHIPQAWLARVFSAFLIVVAVLGLRRTRKTPR
jgi:uncharacterized membrane protein YfcA